VTHEEVEEEEEEEPITNPHAYQHQEVANRKKLKGG